MENNMEKNMAIMMHELGHYLFCANKAHRMFTKEMRTLVSKHMHILKNGSEEEVIALAQFIGGMLCSSNGEEISNIVAAYAIAVTNNNPKISHLALSYAMNEGIEDARIERPKSVYPDSILRMGKS